MSYLALFVSLPAKASTVRMRIWRALKALGCATLRDGVYLLPDSVAHAQALEEVAADVFASGGSGDVFRLAGCDEGQDVTLRGLFDRADDYAALAEEMRSLKQALATLEPGAVARKLQSLGQRFEQVVNIDFYPGEAQNQTLARLDDLRAALTRLQSPDEPGAGAGEPPRLNRADYQGRVWATRARPWVDRLASAWLIRRFIDPDARIVWLASPADCQADWLGFDFDGAVFSHAGARVTFEVLLASFALESHHALMRLAGLVHYLDVGGLPVADAPGVETLLGGLRVAEADDDALLARASEVFEWLLRGYEEKPQ